MSVPCGRIGGVRVLVTGGTGTLGSSIVAQLRERGHQPTIGSRKPGPDRVVIDLATGAGIDAATVDTDAIIHCASDPGRHARSTDVDGTMNLARSGIPVLYMSIVGVDRHPFRYYRIKREGELALAANSEQWTVLRATQFHAFVDWIMSSSKSALGKLPGNRGDDARFPATRGFKVQPVAHEEVAAHAITLIEAGTTNSIEQFGGPQEFDSEELARTWAKARGGRPVFVPTVGRIARAFKDGAVIPEPGTPTGSLTWADYLSKSG